MTNEPANDEPDPSGPDPDLLAAEYVLGVLDLGGTARCDALRRADPAFAGLVAEWEARLMPLAAAVPAVAPPANLLARIEVAAGLRAPGRPGPWRAATAAALLAASVLAVALLLRQGSAPQVAVLAPPGSVGLFALQPAPGGGLEVRPLQPGAVPAGRALQLWSMPAGAGAPRSLGVLPEAGVALPPGSVPPGLGQILVSLEPPGGSPTGQPTGPVVLAAPFPAR